MKIRSIHRGPKLLFGPPSVGAYGASLSYSSLGTGLFAIDEDGSLWAQIQSAAGGNDYRWQPISMETA